MRAYWQASTFGAAPSPIRVKSNAPGMVHQAPYSLSRLYTTGFDTTPLQDAILTIIDRPAESVHYLRLSEDADKRRPKRFSDQVSRKSSQSPTPPTEAPSRESSSYNTNLRTQTVRNSLKLSACPARTACTTDTDFSSDAFASTGLYR